jgi:hypothetical protein
VGLNNISNNELNQMAQVTIYSMLGQTIFKENLLIQENNGLSIDISSQAKGVYLIIINTANKIMHKQVVLQ